MSRQRILHYQPAVYVLNTRENALNPVKELTVCWLGAKTCCECLGLYQGSVFILHTSDLYSRTSSKGEDKGKYIMDAVRRGFCVSGECVVDLPEDGKDLSRSTSFDNHQKG